MLKPPSLLAYIRRNRSAAIGMRLTDLLDGIVQSLACPSTRQLSPVYPIHLEGRRLAPGTTNVRLAAVRRLADEAAEAGLLSPELAAGIRRVKGSKRLGVRLGNWLTAEQARSLWQPPNAGRQKASGIERFWPFYLAAGFVVENCPTLRSTISSVAKSTGPSLIWSERGATSEPSPSLLGGANKSPLANRRLVSRR